MDDIHAFLNGRIADPNCSPHEAAVAIVDLTYCQILNGQDATEKAELEQALNAFVSLARRLCAEPDYVHFIRLVIHQPAECYRERLNEEESEQINCTEYNEYFSPLITLLEKCLRQVDPNQHVTGKEAHLEWLPQDMVKPTGGWSTIFEKTNL